jgi:hypothetical protein
MSYAPPPPGGYGQQGPPGQSGQPGQPAFYEQPHQGQPPFQGPPFPGQPPFAGQPAPGQGQPTAHSQFGGAPAAAPAAASPPNARGADRFVALLALVVAGIGAATFLVGFAPYFKIFGASANAYESIGAIVVGFALVAGLVAALGLLPASAGAAPAADHSGLAAAFALVALVVNLAQFVSLGAEYSAGVGMILLLLLLLGQTAAAGTLLLVKLGRVKAPAPRANTSGFGGARPQGGSGSQPSGQGGAPQGWGPSTYGAPGFGGQGFGGPAGGNPQGFGPGYGAPTHGGRPPSAPTQAGAAPAGPGTNPGASNPNIGPTFGAPGSPQTGFGRGFAPPPPPQGGFDEEQTRAFPAGGPQTYGSGTPNYGPQNQPYRGPERGGRRETDDPSGDQQS